MPSKTPLFDAALRRFFSTIQPGERTCAETGEKFELSAKDIALYRDLGVPPTQIIFGARMRHQRAFLPGFDLFRRTLPDGSSVVSMYDPESPISLIGQADWHAARLQETFMQQAHAYDFDRSFFSQWKEFSLSIPRPAILNDIRNQNSEWSVYTLESKNCYGTFGGANHENVLHSDQGLRNHDCSDISICFDLAFCYDDVSCQRCSTTHFSHSCEDCIDTVFSLGCHGCQDCFGCTNLKNKKYCFLNEQLTQEAYRAKRSAIDLSDANVVAEWKEKMKEPWSKAPRRASYRPNSEDAHGDDLRDSNDVIGVSIHDGERVHWAFGSISSRDCIDTSTCLYNERVVNSVYITKGYEYRMCLSCNHCLDVEYSELLEGCEHCFGCIGLINKKFCLFNKQYAEEEYWPLVDRLKTNMLTRGEYGQFFPYDCSLFAYNTSHANTFAPVEEAEARRLGQRWYIFPDQQTDALPIEQLPLKLKDATDEILKNMYRCPQTGRAFRVVKPELEFHRAINVALPRLHPVARRIERMRDGFPLELWKRPCSNCGTIISTRIPASYPAPILCDLCFARAQLDF